MRSLPTPLVFDGAGDRRQLLPRVRGGTEVVNIQLNECAFSFDSALAPSRNVAFRVENANERPHRVVVDSTSTARAP